ncbi:MULTISPECIES: hypothetical protein [Natrialbaceae]|uniref:hypothetical protein n=1 Tax=Natrialbaceae TaxID=1644061 RepID=UPI00207D6FC7|nr:hypothetical protein [Natronococcus sp. CG52]
MSTHDCPLCSETYEERTDLRVHLEVSHRKSEIVAYLVEDSAETGNPAADGEPAFEDESPAPPA